MTENDLEEDDVEILSLDEGEEKGGVIEYSVNEVYNKKKEEINKIVADFSKEIESCTSIFVKNKKNRPQLADKDNRKA